MPRIKATASQVGSEIVIEAQLVDTATEEVLHEETFRWGADVPRAVIARETRLLLKERMAEQPVPLTLAGLDGQEV